MGKKLKKDFKERHKASLEREMFHSKTDTIPEESKLKHNDDYRGKIVHEKERFQDKVHEKTSKVSADNEKSYGTSKRNKKYRASDKGDVNSSIETGRSDYITEVKDGKIYDPLGKDLDNDGIIDRYDNDFRDSDYFESTYDVEDNLHKKDEFIGSSSKNYKAQKSRYKRKNYTDSLYTRKKDDVLKENKPEDKKTGKDTASKKVHSSIYKEQKKKLKRDMVKVSTLSGLAKGSETVRDYLSHGSDENQGVEAGEKTADTSSKLIHGIKKYSDKKGAKRGYDLTNKDYKIRKRKSKLEFRDAKKELKKTDEYKRASAYKRFQKKNQVKAAISRENKSRLRDRIKEGLIGTLKSSKDMIIRKAKGLMLIFIGIIILGTFVINFAGIGMTGFMNSTSSVLTTSYLSKPNVLSEINHKFSDMEGELQSEVDHVKENYPMFGNKCIKKKKDGTKYKDFYYYGCKHRHMIRGHKCTYNKQIREELLDDAVAEVIIKIVSNPQFASMMQEKINMKVDTSEIEKEIDNYQKELRKSHSTKFKLIEEIDNLDADDKHYKRRKQDLDDRLYRMYDKIEDLESLLIDAKAKKQTIEAEKLTGDNIYKILIYFDKLYKVMNDVERRQLITALISEIQIYEEKQPNGQWLKSITFKLPIIDEDLNIGLDNNEQVETLVLMSRI